jgi:hypothetical protein
MPVQQEKLSTAQTAFRKTMLLPFPYSAGQEEYLVKENVFINFVKSRVVAVCFILFSFLQPIEAFALNCQNTGMMCTDSTPCKSISGQLVCLSTVSPLPAGAIRSTQPCWNSTGSYSCLDATSPMQDTCATLTADPACGKISATCILTDPATGGCTAYSDKYSCQTDGGATQTQTDCSGQTYCIDGVCYSKKDKPNNALAKVITGMEVSRLAGFYMDTASMTVFKGEGSWCSQNNWGLANCCKPDPKGASFTNAIIVNELIKNGWNAWAKEVVGNSTTYDTLFTQASGFMDKAVVGMQQVLDGNVIGAGKTLIGGSATAGIYNPPAGGATGGMLGGMIGQTIGTGIGASFSSNKGIQGTFGAAGYAAGTIGGTYVGAGAYALVNGSASAIAYGAGTTTLSAAGSVASNAVGAICVPCLTAVVVLMVIQAFLACDIPEIQTQMKLGAPGLCHHVGSYCSAEVFLIGCVTTRQQYCCFNSKLAKIIQEQGRPQVGRGWGTPQAPDCAGLTIAELGQIDFSKMDLSSFFADIVAKATPDAAKLAADAAAKTSAFFTSASSPTATYGVVPPPVAGIPQPVTITTIDPAPTPPMPACNTLVTKSPMAVNGDQSGSIAVNSCLANGIASFVYTGTCPTLQTNTVIADVPLDASGAGIFNTVVPSACSTSNNLWTARIINPVSGNMPGKINVMW